MKYKVWNCKIVVPNDVELPQGFDSPPRRAAIEIIENYDVPVISCFSGWDGKLTDEQERFVDRNMKRKEK